MLLYVFVQLLFLLFYRFVLAMIFGKCITCYLILNFFFEQPSLRPSIFYRIELQIIDIISADLPLGADDFVAHYSKFLFNFL